MENSNGLKLVKEAFYALREFFWDNYFYHYF